MKHDRRDLIPLNLINFFTPNFDPFLSRQEETISSFLILYREAPGTGSMDCVLLES